MFDRKLNQPFHDAQMLEARFISSHLLRLTKSPTNTHRRESDMKPRSGPSLSSSLTQSPPISPWNSRQNSSLSSI
jgi:hypothetical protein